MAPAAIEDTIVLPNAEKDSSVDIPNKSNAKNMALPVAVSWSEGMLERYEPIRPLGKGAFGIVWMAKARSEKKSEDNLPYVAIKTIIQGNHHDDSRQMAYAQRETAILSELSHPHLVKLLGFFSHEKDEECDVTDASSNDESPEASSNYVLPPPPKCIIMSVVHGPSLEKIVNAGGAIGWPMAREISRQLIEAVAYLHGKAVIHRDIKPDNILIKGASLSANDSCSCWSDGIEAERAAVKEKKWHLVLIDFGFARALRPSEVRYDIGLYKTIYGDENEVNADNTNKETRQEEPQDGNGCQNQEPHSTKINENKCNLTTENSEGPNDKSMSHVIVRDLSAVGHRHFAAPEILSGVRKLERKMSSRSKRNVLDASHSSNAAEGEKGTTKMHRMPFSDCVSDYGMVADAYSVGATIRYMITGIPPHMSMEEFNSMRNHPISKLARFLSRNRPERSNRANKDKSEAVGKKKPNKKGTFQKVYRCKEEDLQCDALHLICSLTHRDHRKRSTVRAAKSHPWIAPKELTSPAPKETISLTNEEFGKKEIIPPLPSLHHGGCVDFLQCALSEADFPRSKA